MPSLLPIVCPPAQGCRISQVTAGVMIKWVRTPVVRIGIAYSAILWPPCARVVAACARHSRRIVINAAVHPPCLTTTMYRVLSLPSVRQVEVTLQCKNRGGIACHSTTCVLRVRRRCLAPAAVGFDPQPRATPQSSPLRIESRKMSSQLAVELFTIYKYYNGAQQALASLLCAIAAT
jgi:hypothetical protein